MSVCTFFIWLYGKVHYTYTLCMWLTGSVLVRFVGDFFHILRGKPTDVTSSAALPESPFTNTEHCEEREIQKLKRDTEADQSSHTHTLTFLSSRDFFFFFFYQTMFISSGLRFSLLSCRVCGFPDLGYFVNLMIYLLCSRLNSFKPACTPAIVTFERKKKKLTQTIHS